MKKYCSLLFIVLLAAITCKAQGTKDDDVKVTQNGMVTTMSNGWVKITIGENGRISNMTYRNGSNLIGSSGVYFDFTSKSLGNKPLSPAKAEIVRQTADYAEVVYSNTSYPPHFQQGFIMRRGVSGVYMYVVANGNEESANLQVQEMRVCTRLASTFLNGYVDDSMQGTIPSNSEMQAVESGGTANENYVQDATYRMKDGSVYTKYNWAQYIIRDSVHGLMNSNTGVWNIPCSREWYPGGPMKQELTVHATGKSPITIQMLQGEHFGTPSVYYQPGERKLYGPFLLYLNGGTKEQMIADAKSMAHQQEAEWPFAWFEHEEYPLDRATVSGQIQLTTGQSCDSLQVVLAEPDVELYQQANKYIFWALTDNEGRFSTKNVRKGKYTLYAYATKGDITDELQQKDVTVGDGETDLGTISWTPTCYEQKLFQIGENNRMSDGFHLSDTLRNYGLWNLVPASLTYRVGESKPETDWWYAQTHNGTWTIEFDCPQTYTGNAYFTVSVAGAANKPKVAVKVNGTTRTTWSFPNNDAGIYRSAVLGGRHQVKTCTFPASLLKKGTNKIDLTMSGIGSNGGVMYDCLKLEVGPKVTDGITPMEIADNSRITIYTLSGVCIGTFNNQSLSNLPLPKGIYIFKQGTKSGKFAK